MFKELDIVLGELKFQHHISCKRSECSDDEVAKSWSRLKMRIIDEIKEENPQYIPEIIKTISKV